VVLCVVVLETTGGGGAYVVDRVTLSDTTPLLLR
jgi:hypothetical protein